MLRGLAVRAFGVTDVVDDLDLTQEQRRRIAEIRDNLKLQLQPFQAIIESNDPPKDYSEAMSLEKDTAAIHADAYQQALNVLTSTQRKAYDEMIGPMR